VGGVATRGKWRQIFRWGFALYTLAAAGLMIAQTLAIYWSGTSGANLGANGVYLHDVYSRETVAERFAAISLPIYGWIAAAILSLVCIAIFRPEVPKSGISRDPLGRLLRVLSQIPLDTLNAESDEVRAARRERRRIRICVWLLAILGFLGLLTAAVYLALGNPFDSRELEPVMGRLLRWLLVPTAMEMIVAGAAVAYLNAKASRALPAMQALTVRGKAATAQAKPAPRAAGLITARAVLYALAVALVIWGVLNQGMRDVLIKAINICTECVGLG
jgi:hypothetical protein